MKLPILYKTQMGLGVQHRVETVYLYKHDCTNCSPKLLFCSLFQRQISLQVKTSLSGLKEGRFPLPYTSTLCSVSSLDRVQNGN